MTIDDEDILETVCGKGLTTAIEKFNSLLAEFDAAIRDDTDPAQTTTPKTPASPAAKPPQKTEQQNWRYL